MTVKVIPYVFSGDVATNGTFTVAYPGGFSKGSFAEGKIRKMFVNQKTFVAPNDFTVSFGATTATITYKGLTTIKSGARASIEFDIPGEQVVASQYQHLAVGQVNRLQPMLIDLGSPLVAVTTAFISAATGTELPNTATKTYTTANIGTSPCDGANTTWINDVPRNVTLTASHNSSIVAMTVGITGVDVFNQPLYELLTLTATGTSKSVTGLNAFYKITKVDLIAATDATANTISIGFGSALGLPVHISAVREIMAEIQDGALVGGYPSVMRLPFFVDVADELTGTAANPELIAPFDGVVSRLGLSIRAAVTTGGVVKAKVGTTDVAGATLTVANSATKGTIAFASATYGDSTAVIAKDGRIQISVDDAFATAGEMEGFLEVVPTGLRSGTLVTGLSPNTAPTSTTGDVRGTYTPNATMDGTIGFILLAMVANPTYIGTAPYHV